jgi:hypothetical protein
MIYDPLLIQEGVKNKLLKMFKAKIPEFARRRQESDDLSRTNN